MDDAIPLVVGPGGGETVRNPVGGIVTFKATGMETASALTVFESVIAPGDGPPLHVHAREDEVLYVLEGEFRFQLGEEVHEAPEGSLMYVPRDVAHCFQNVASHPSRLLITFTPAGMEHFFALSGGDPAAFAQAAEVVGMEVVGPPLSQRDAG
jgi:quercetin dioxygenase-like cupin family protein